MDWKSPRRIAAFAAALSAAAFLLMAQPRGSRRQQYPEWEVRTVLPREIAPARYRQVDEWELQEAARQGWELVSSSPYALQNEERGPEGRKQVVTQVYTAYVFKRLREPPQRPE
ncbi:MAG: hypothetical protein R2729_11575 [Bryobacteraceae bacterium]